MAGESNEQTREALLDVAEETFFGGSWQTASLEAIAAGAGVTKQTLLRHFGSKDGLRVQAGTRALERVRAQRWAAPTGDVAGVVSNLLDHYEAVADRALNIGRLAQEVGADEILADARQLHHDWVDHAFGAWLRARDGDVRRQLRATLIVLCDVQAWRTLTQDLGLPRPEVQATLTRSIERLLEETA